MLTPILQFTPPPQTYLRINGNAYPVADDGSHSQTPFTIGEATRSFAGSLRSTVQSVKREWTLTTTEITDATYLAMVADMATQSGAPLVGGDIVAGLPVACVVLITNETDIYDANVRKRRVTLSIREV